jgi:porin
LIEVKILFSPLMHYTIPKITQLLPDLMMIKQTFFLASFATTSLVAAFAVTPVLAGEQSLISTAAAVNSEANSATTFPPTTEPSTLPEHLSATQASVKSTRAADLLPQAPEPLTDQPTSILLASELTAADLPNAAPTDSGSPDSTTPNSTPTDAISPDSTVPNSTSTDSGSPDSTTPTPTDSPQPAPNPQPNTSQTAPSQSIWQRSQLTGDWGGVRSKLQKKGVTFNFEWTQFYQGLAAGTGSKTFDYGGRLDALIDLDTGKLGLWKGGGLHTHLEYRYGYLPAFRGGALWPVNTGEILPLGSKDTVVASSLYLSHQFGDRTSLLIGKINVVDLLAGDLFFGGWGNRRFMNVAFVAPPSGVLPPVIFGAIVNVKIKPVTLTFMVFDPNDKTNKYWPDDLFRDGVNFSAGATYVGAIAGRPTTYSLSATYSTKDVTDLSDVLLPLVGAETTSKDGSYSIAFQFSHLLHQNPANPREGWGIFLKAAIADGNPNPIQNSLQVGLGGKGLFRGREQDGFGIGYYYYNFSNVLENTLEPILNLDDEQGVEIFYSYAVTPWFFLTSDLQYISPASGDNQDAFVVGLRTSIRF